MIKQEHTPGPWNIQSDPCHYDTLSIVVANERMIVHVGGCCEPAEQEANARLIAAAPALLEALVYCRQKMAYMTTHGEWYSHGRSFDIADAAIAKAKGEV